MLKKLLASALETIKAHQAPFVNPGGEDPIAQATVWAPHKSGGSNFRTHKLQQIHPDRLVFKASGGAIATAVGFLGFGLLALVGCMGLALYGSSTTPWFAPLFILVFAVVFGGIGLYLFIQFGTPIVFDRTKGAFWKGRKEPDQVFDPSQLKCHVKLSEIHALQIISEYIRSDKSSYYSHELNLVLKDASRITVVDHGNLKRLREDAATLGQFLRVPVWDAGRG